MLSRQGERYLKQNHGIAVPDYRILMTLVNLGEMSVREVAQHTKMDKALISRVVNRLVSNRLVRSMPDPDDGRLLLLTYTSAGLALYKELLPFVQNRQRDLLAALGDTDKREFVRSLDKLIHFLDASD